MRRGLCLCKGFAKTECFKIMGVQKLHLHGVERIDEK